MKAYKTRTWNDYKILKEDSINTVDVSEIVEVKLAEKNGEQYIFGITNHIDDIWWQGFKLEYEYDGRDLFELYHLYREDYIINNPTYFGEAVIYTPDFSLYISVPVLFTFSTIV